MLNHLKRSIPDIVLCTLMSAGLASGICSGFEMTSPSSDSAALLLVLAAIMSIIMAVLAYRRAYTIAGIAGAAVLAVCTVIYMQAVHPLKDEAANARFIFVYISIIAGVLVYLLCRTRPGIIALFLVGTFVSACADFLQFENNVWSMLIFTFAALAMYMYRVYMISADEADVGSASRRPYLVQAGAFVMAVVVLASGIFFFIVKPLDPPTQELKLIRIMKQMDSLEVLGIFHTSTVLNPFLNSTETPESTEFTPDQGEDESEDIENSDTTEEDDTVTDSNIQEKVDAIWYVFSEQHLGWIIVVIVLIIVCALIYYISGKRKRWYKSVETLTHEDAVLNLYDLFLRDLARAGVKKPDQHTLREFCDFSAYELEKYDAGVVTFAELSAIYERILYGMEKVSDEDYQKFETYYKAFYSNLKKSMGLPRYMLKWIWL